MTNTDAKKVEIFTKSGCEVCKSAKTYLTEQGVQFTERNVTADPRALQQLQRFGSQTTPTIVVDGEAIIGFGQPQKQRLNQLLDLAVPQL
jgi:glutaredoxin